MRTKILTTLGVVALAGMASYWTAAGVPVAAADAGPQMTSIGPLTFGPDGVLFAADTQAATIYALELGDKANGGAPDGAAQVSGAPWHMRTLQLDGSGNKNQDRSIQPSAIVGELAPQALAPATPRPTAAPTPAAPRTTPRPTAVPTSGGPRLPDGGTTGNPAGPASAFPRLTPPATSTTDDLPTPVRDDGAGILAASAMLLGMIALATRRPATRRRRGS